jgi:small-conductance mechanosensitive channel
LVAFIAGITIMFDRPFQVGDRVGPCRHHGDIIAVELRSVPPRGAHRRSKVCRLTRRHLLR